MNRPRAALLGLALGLAGAATGYGLTPGGAPRTTKGHDSDNDARVSGVSSRSLEGSPEMDDAFKKIEDILIQGGVDPVLIEEARSNPDRPIRADWWAIILKFLTIGVGLSIDVAILTVLMKRMETPADKMKWGISVPAMHWILPEVTGHGAAAIFSGAPLSFTAAACFVVLLYKMHADASEAAISTTQNAVTRTLLGTAIYAGSVSMDALAAGPGIAQQAAELGTTPEIANGIQAFGGVLTCTALAIGLQKKKDRLLELIDEERAEILGKALAAGAFSYFLLDCLMDGLNSLCGGNIPPDIQKAAILGLTAIAPVVSLQYSTRAKAGAQIPSE